MIGFPVPLTQGLVAYISAEDIPLVWRRSWCVSRVGSKVYAVSYERGSGRANRRAVLMHRLVMDAPPGLVVDHIDGDGLNNTRANLRLCRQAENVMNRGRNKNNRSGFKGVYFHRATGRYLAQLALRGGHVYLGLHPTAESAAMAYDAEVSKRFGAFARLNFPTEVVAT